MKGLLLKDLYMLKYYCKSYIAIALVFLAVSLFGGTDNVFFVVYPCLLCGVLPVNLISYDERSGFLKYSAALPYTKKQIVSSKYLLGLLTEAVILVLTALAQGVKMKLKGEFELSSFAVLILSLAVAATFCASIILPFIFKSGVEKGRIVYFVMMGAVCAASFIFSSASLKVTAVLTAKATPGVLFALLAFGIILIYVLSWNLSVMFYKKREF